MSEPQERKRRGKNRKRVIKMKVDGVEHTLTWWLESQTLTVRRFGSRHPWTMTPQQLVDAASGQYPLPLKITPSRNPRIGLVGEHEPAVAAESGQEGTVASAAHDLPVSQQLALLEVPVEDGAAVTAAQASQGITPGAPPPEAKEDAEEMEPVHPAVFDFNNF